MSVKVSPCGLVLPTKEQMSKRYLVEVSDDGEEWVLAHRVLPMRSNYGWKEDEANHWMERAKILYKPIADGFVKIRVRAEDVEPEKPLFSHVPDPPEKPAKKEQPRAKKRGRSS